MPPRTRASKTTKGLKENINVIENTKLKSAGRVTKPTRKALADKTNSASDDNASFERNKKVIKKPKITSTLRNIEVEIVNTGRPHRDRRPPKRFVENDVLKSFSNSEENASITPVSMETRTPSKNVMESPFKTSPPKETLQPTSRNVEESILLTSRPRRISRLPTKFEGHLVSPNKSVTLVPAHSSTPIVLTNKNSKINKVGKSIANRKPLIKNQSVEVFKKSSPKDVPGEIQTKKPEKCQYKKMKDNSISKSRAADTNNNAKYGRTLRSKRTNTQMVNLSPTDKSISESLTSSKSGSSKQKNGISGKKPLHQNLSFRVLEDKKQSAEYNDNNQDVYEFTYDPKEDPPPQKKKRKRIVKKKPVQPKTFFVKSSYDQTLSKALKALKNKVSQKSKQVATNTVVKSKENNNELSNNVKIQQINQEVTKNVVKSQQINESYTTVDTVQPSTSGAFKISEQDHASIRVEDIAADFEPSLDHHEIDYSPISHPRDPIGQQSKTEQSTEKEVLVNNDPLNLQDDFSFFDDEPVASSSMHMSVKHPHGSPWRMDFQNLPIKWRVNSYVKPNMTPAMECSFVNFEDDKKKHVYTNIMSEDSNPVPEIVPNDEPNLKQTSILSFIKEVVERSASKKKRDRSTTPNRATSVFDDLTSKSGDKPTDEVNLSVKKICTPKKSANRSPLTPINTTVSDNISADNASHDKESSKENRKRKNDSDSNVIPAKTKTLRKEKDTTYFGFDDSENEDNENAFPHKPNTRGVRDLRSRARAVLKEINAQTGPTRVMLPVSTMKSKAITSEAGIELQEERKSATDMPVSSENSPMEDVITCDVNEAVGHETVVDDDSQSVHLFEDIQVIHHLKPTRKSYGNAKKVTFRQRSISNSDTQDSDMPGAVHEISGEEDDLADLTFEIPTVKEKRVTKKKMTKKQKLSKKEEREAEAWAAGFNSMCEDIEDFPLVVE